MRETQAFRRSRKEGHPPMRTLLMTTAILAGLTTATALAAGMASDRAPDMATVGEITIHHPWARASLGAAPNSAVYMDLETMGSEPDRLLGGSTPVAEEVQLHTHLMDEGVARMRPVEAIEVAPGTPTVLAPGGLHVMLVGLTEKLEEGSTMPLTLVFETAGEVTLEVPVRGLAGGMSHGDDDAMDHEQRTN